MKIMLDKGAKMPTRAHPWDAGLDLYAPERGYGYSIPPAEEVPLSTLWYTYRSRKDTPALSRQRVA